MSPEEQRITTAKACGWRKIHGAEIYEWSWMNRDNRGTNELPDYLNDLNAMHEAEKTLSENQRTCYIQWVVKIGSTGVPPFFHAVIATAAQRAEAFLRTIGKWKD